MKQLVFYTYFVVAQVFLQPKFNLEEPTTFNEVLPWSNFQKTGTKRNSGKLLQEKVSYSFFLFLLNK